MDEAVRNAMREVKSVIAELINNPSTAFFGILLRKTWIYLERGARTAYTDGLSIVVDPEDFLRIPPIDRKFRLVHEVMHIVLQHPVRFKEWVERWKTVFDPITVNAVCDAKANQYLEGFRPHLKLEGAWPDTIEELYGIKDVKVKSVEEILHELAQKGVKIKIEVPPDLLMGGGGGGQGEGEGERERQRLGQGREVGRKERGERGQEEKQGQSKGGGSRERVVANEGDGDDQKARSEDEMRRRRIAQKMVETLHAAKAIGRVPAEMERLVDELLKPVIDWRRIVRSALTKGVGRKIRRTWARPSRKAPECYPGKETLKTSEVVLLIDTSGSIGSEELKRFASEAYGALRESSRVVVIPWDATTHEPIILRGYGDLERVKALKGGGGTMIRDALKMVKEKFSSADRIAILSDWHIGDLGSEEVQRLLREMASKIVAFTTDARPSEFLEWYKIEITP